MKFYTEIFNALYPYKTTSRVYEVPQGMDILEVTQASIPQTFMDSAICHLQLLQNEKETIIILTELDTNQGLSITNAAEILARKIVTQFNLNPKQTRFIERYGKESYSEGSDYGKRESFDEVFFMWEDTIASNPKWVHLDIQEVVKIRAKIKQKKQSKKKLSEIN